MIYLVEQNWFAKNGSEHRNTKAQSFIYLREQSSQSKVLDRMKELVLTQKMLAERMGYSQEYVSKVLRGRENLSLETLCKIKNVLNLQ